MSNRDFYSVEQFGRQSVFRASSGETAKSLGVDCVTPSEHNTAMLARKYGNDARWISRWAESRLDLLRNAGFNTLGAWHSAVYHETSFPRTVEIRMSRFARKVNTVWGTGFPDVFDSSFEISAHTACLDTFARGGAPLAADRDLIGYFTDNELHWWGSSGYWGQDDQGTVSDSTELVDDYIRLPPAAAGKRRWIAHLQERYGAIDALNASWKSEYPSFEALAHLEFYRARPEAIAADKQAFLRLIAQRYFGVTSSVLSFYDPNHLNLGCRLVGVSTPDVVLKEMAQVVDVCSVNFYSLTVPSRYLAAIHRVVEKPLLITEFSFCAGESAGFTRITNGAQAVYVRDQKRRGEVYRSFLAELKKLDYVVGAHWFALYDYGNHEGLIGNYGLCDLSDEPYSDFLEDVAAANREYLDA